MTEAAAPHAKAARALRAAPPMPAAAPAFGAGGGIPGASKTFRRSLVRLRIRRAEEAATQVLYRFPGKVTLASGSTMMIPFTDREITASRTTIYQPETNATRPLAAVRLTNDGDSALPAGLVTSFETGPMASRLRRRRATSAPVEGSDKVHDLRARFQTEIRREDRGVKQTRLGKASRGELTLTVKSRWAIDYEITPPGEEDREVFIEEPRQDGWKAAGDTKDIEETATRLRYRVVAPKGKTTKATLTREHIDYQTSAFLRWRPTGSRDGFGAAK